MKTGFDKGVIDGLLSALAQPACDEKELEITPEMLERKARAMARRGYRHTERSLEALRLYLSGYGLFLQGPVGTGKTLFFRLLKDFGGEDIEIFSMHNILGRNESDIREMMDDLAFREIVLDDIGAEPTFNNYGVKFDILAYLIDRRMESAERTHFTTNLAKSEIASRYGGRVIDRLAEMCRSVKFEGRSLRAPKPNRKALGIVREYMRREDAQKRALEREDAPAPITTHPDASRAPAALLGASDAKIDSTQPF